MFYRKQQGAFNTDENISCQKTRILRNKIGRQMKCLPFRTREGKPKLNIREFFVVLMFYGQYFSELSAKWQQNESYFLK